MTDPDLAIETNVNMEAVIQPWRLVLEARTHSLTWRCWRLSGQIAVLSANDSVAQNEHDIKPTRYCDGRRE